MRNVCQRLIYACCIITVLTGALLMAGCGKENKMKYTNVISPIIDQEGADPYVLKQGDWYYYTKTTGNNITLSRTKNLTEITVGDSKVLYEPPFELVDLWAPEIFNLDNSWYVYFAARVPGEEMHFMYVLSNENEDPFEGEWTCQPLKGMDDKFAIDGTVLDLPSGRYFIWSGWNGYVNVQQNLYLAEMISPTEVMEEKILLTSPEYDWEKSGEPFINEGPAVLVNGDVINLVYSASGSWTDDYCLGLLTADANADVKSPEAWTKAESPIFSKANDVWGPGHNCFTTTPDDKETIMVYHAARWAGAGWSRSVRFQYVDFEESGAIAVMEPIASDEKLMHPSGEKSRVVYAGENIKIGEPFEIEGGGILDLHIYVKLLSYTGDQDVTGLEVIIDGETYYAPIYPSDYYQPVSFQVELENGKHSVEILSETGVEDFVIDRVEIEQQ